MSICVNLCQKIIDFIRRIANGIGNCIGTRRRWNIFCALPCIEEYPRSYPVILEVANEKARKKVEGQLKNMLRVGDIEDVYKRVKRRSNRI